jgi:1,4-alpha-glucan branching enzyme
MPFGAACGGGGVTFRLWAPAPRQAELAIETAAPPELHPAAGDAEGCGNAPCRTRRRHPVPLAHRRQAAGARPGLAPQPGGPHGPSSVVDPVPVRLGRGWTGRPWPRRCCTSCTSAPSRREGTFAGGRRRLKELADTGITAVELMPVADFAGRFGWGYDGVLPYRAASRLRHAGRPQALRAAGAPAGPHGVPRRGLQPLRPEGNYLRAYAPDFFSPARAAPGARRINFDGPGSEHVREFFIHNALYWLQEYRFDGLRLDAVHAIHDDSPCTAAGNCPSACAPPALAATCT